MLVQISPWRSVTTSLRVPFSSSSSPASLSSSRRRKRSGDEMVPTRAGVSCVLWKGHAALAASFVRCPSDKHRKKKKKRRVTNKLRLPQTAPSKSRDDDSEDDIGDARVVLTSSHAIAVVGSATAASTGDDSDGPASKITITNSLVESATLQFNSRPGPTTAFLPQKLPSPSSSSFEFINGTHHQTPNNSNCKAIPCLYDPTTERMYGLQHRNTTLVTWDVHSGNGPDDYHDYNNPESTDHCSSYYYSSTRKIHLHGTAVSLDLLPETDSGENDTHDEPGGGVILTMDDGTLRIAFWTAPQKGETGKITNTTGCGSGSNNRLKLQTFKHGKLDKNEKYIRTMIQQSSNARGSSSKGLLLGNNNIGMKRNKNFHVNEVDSNETIMEVCVQVLSYKHSGKNQGLILRGHDILVHQNEPADMDKIDTEETTDGGDDDFKIKHRVHKNFIPLGIRGEEKEKEEIDPETVMVEKMANDGNETLVVVYRVIGCKTNADESLDESAKTNGKKDVEDETVPPLRDGNVKSSALSTPYYCSVVSPASSSTASNSFQSRKVFTLPADTCQIGALTSSILSITTRKGYILLYDIRYGAIVHSVSILDALSLDHSPQDKGQKQHHHHQQERLVEWDVITSSDTGTLGVISNSQGNVRVTLSTISLDGTDHSRIQNDKSGYNLAVALGSALATTAEHTTSSSSLMIGLDENDVHERGKERNLLDLLSTTNNSSTNNEYDTIDAPLDRLRKFNDGLQAVSDHNHTASSSLQSEYEEALECVLIASGGRKSGRREAGDKKLQPQRKQKVHHRQKPHQQKTRREQNHQRHLENPQDATPHLSSLSDEGKNATLLNGHHHNHRHRPAINGDLSTETPDIVEEEEDSEKFKKMKKADDRQTTTAGGVANANNDQKNEDPSREGDEDDNNSKVKDSMDDDDDDEDNSDKNRHAKKDARPVCNGPIVKKNRHITKSGKFGVKTPKETPQRFIDGVMPLVLSILLLPEEADTVSTGVGGDAHQFSQSQTRRRQQQRAKCDARLILKSLIQTGKVSSRLYFDTPDPDDGRRFFFSVLAQLGRSHPGVKTSFYPMEFIYDIVQFCPDVSERLMVTMIHYALCHATPFDVASNLLKSKESSRKAKSASKHFMIAKSEWARVHRREDTQEIEEDMQSGEKNKTKKMSGRSSVDVQDEDEDRYRQSARKKEMDDDGVETFEDEKKEKDEIRSGGVEVDAPGERGSNKDVPSKHSQDKEAGSKVSLEELSHQVLREGTKHLLHHFISHSKCNDVLLRGALRRGLPLKHEADIVVNALSTLLRETSWEIYNAPSNLQERLRNDTVTIAQWISALTDAHMWSIVAPGLSVTASDAQDDDGEETGHGADQFQRSRPMWRVCRTVGMAVKQAEAVIALRDTLELADVATNEKLIDAEALHENPGPMYSSSGVAEAVVPVAGSIPPYSIERLQF